MKKYILIAGVVALMAACSNNQSNTTTNATSSDSASVAETGSFGATIDEAGAITMPELLAQMEGKTEMEAKVTGTITECCKKKGCWMNIDRGDGTTMKVTFKDYGFFVPLTSGGKTAVMHGKAFMDTISVEDLRHYAEDAGKSKEEIEKITAPSLELSFEADGVIVK